MSDFNTKLPFLPYGKQNITEEDIYEVTKVLESDFLTQGPKVPIFEKEICKKVNSKYAIASNSATSSLHLACMALGLSKDDVLWTSPITFVASANCALYCGAKVDFVDINQDNALIDINLLKEKLIEADKVGKLPKILVPVHLAGSSCDMKSIYELSKKYGFYVIEDASHAIGGKYLDQPIGSCLFSDITIFSFHPVKIITTGEGGIATTNCKNLAETMAELRSHGITKDQNKFLEKRENENWRYEQQKLGFNYRLTDISASLGLSQLKRLEPMIKERNLLFENYKKHLYFSDLKMLEIPQGVYSALHLAILRFKDIDLQSKLYENLRKSCIGSQVHYMPVHLQPYYKSHLGFKEGDFPESEYYSKTCLSLPIYPGLQLNDQSRVIDTILGIVGKK